MSLLDELSEEEYQKILDRVEERELRRCDHEPTPKKDPREVKRKPRPTKSERQLKQESLNRARKEQTKAVDAVIDGLGNFGFGLASEMVPKAPRGQAVQGYQGGEIDLDMEID